MIIVSVLDTREVNGVTYRVRLELDTDAPDPREDWDCDDEATIQQWADGEVYGYVIERQCGSCSGWEQVDSLWSLYGYDYAHAAAVSALGEL